MLTVIVVSITKSDFHYHVVISKIVNITLFCSDVHYAVFTVCVCMYCVYMYCVGIYCVCIYCVRARNNGQTSDIFRPKVTYVRTFLAGHSVRTIIFVLLVLKFFMFLTVLSEQIS